MIFLYIIVYIGCIVINSYMFKKKINFASLIVTLWTFASILSMFGFYDMLVPNTQTYIYILYFIISFEAFILIFYKSKLFGKNKNDKDKYDKTLDYELKYKKLNIILIILIGIMLVFSIEGIKIIIGGGSFSRIRDAYLNSENFSNKLQMFNSLVIIPIGHAIGIYAMIDFVDKKKFTSTLGLYFAFLFELTIYTGGRSVIINIVIILMIVLMEKYDNNLLRIVKENKIIVIILMIIIISVGVITLQRNLAGKGIIYNVYCYITGNIHLLGVYVKNPERFMLTKNNLLYGQILISGFSYPITFLLRLFGLDIKAGLYVLYETTQKFVAIAPNTTINNSVTMIVFALRDFGTIGIFIYTAIICLLYTYLCKRKEKDNNILNRALYYYFVKCSIFLLWDFQFSNTGTILLFLYLILLYEFFIKTKEKNIEIKFKLFEKRKEMLNKILQYIYKPEKILIYLDNKNIIKLEDEKYIKLKYKIMMNKELDLDNPQTLNEKLQWLKINDREKIYTTMVDKYEAKEYIANLIGQEHIIQTLGIYDKFEDINFDELPDKFVIKCTHDSGSTIVCKDKNNFCINEARKQINKNLKNNFYKFGREWPYKNVKPRIIIEEYMANNDGTDICDYKFYCFNGHADYVMICVDRQSGEPKFYYYDRYCKLQKEMSNDGKKVRENINIEKPDNIEEMFEIAEKISEGLKFVRVDLYDINNKIYFGEMTFYPSSGFDSTRTIECDEILSSKLKLF